MQVSREQVELVRKLTRLRRESGRSTRALAADLNWSQSKLTKLENARRRPKPTDVDRLLTVLEVSSDVRDRLVDDAWRLKLDGTPLRRLPVPKILESTAMEQDARTIFATSVSYLPMEAQTPEYLVALHNHGNTEINESQFVRNKLQRQSESLRHKQVAKVIELHVLYRPILSIPKWIEQLYALRSTVINTKFEFGVSLPETIISAASRNSTMYDTDAVLSEPMGFLGHFNTSPEVIDEHLSTFDTVTKNSIWGAEALTEVDRAIKRFEFSLS